jgi:hypothetical protein
MGILIIPWTSSFLLIYLTYLSSSMGSSSFPKVIWYIPLLLNKSSIWDFSLEVVGTGKKILLGDSILKYVEKDETNGMDGNILKNMLFKKNGTENGLWMWKLFHFLRRHKL